MSSTDVNPAEIRMLDQLKRQFDPVRRNLCDILSHRDNTPASSRFRWEFNSGNGCYDFMTVTPEEEDTIESLLKAGKIVPTFERDMCGVLTYRLLEHFDDVDFGFVGENIIIYERMPNNEQYRVIRTDKEHDAAITILRDRLKNGTAIISNSIQLTSGKLLRPICADPILVALHHQLG